MSQPLPTTPAALWRQRYEDLRSHVLECRRHLGADPRSVALLCRRGLAGWMRGWQEVTAPGPPPALAPKESPLPLAPLWQHQLTVVLAQMTTQQLTAS